jgi:MYXO-CTERM domain-containing protein
MRPFPQTVLSNLPAGLLGMLASGTALANASLLDGHSAFAPWALLLIGLGLTALLRRPRKPSRIRIECTRQPDQGHQGRHSRY